MNFRRDTASTKVMGSPTHAGRDTVYGGARTSRYGSFVLDNGPGVQSVSLGGVRSQVRTDGSNKGSSEADLSGVSDTVRDQVILRGVPCD